MTQINLLKHQGLSLEAFKTWLNQLIVDKKGALPDLNDWRLIKEKLDKVTVPNIISSMEQTLDAFGEPYWLTLEDLDDDELDSDDDDEYWVTYVTDEDMETLSSELAEMVDTFLLSIEEMDWIEENLNEQKENDNNSNNACEGI